MAATRDIKTWLVVFALCMVLTMQLQNLRVCAEPQVPCFFSFGDSLADNGNNNELATSAKVNYLPYGIDFSDGPTGRFTNGRNTVDILVELFGFEKGIPSYATANGSTSLNGVNYASGTSGIIAASGKHLGDNIHLAKQIINHRITISRIVEVLGNKMATERLNKCLYWVAIGNSDYVHNYYFPGTFYPYRRRYDTEEFADFVIGNYLRHIKKLYSLGARKIVLVGLGKVGCTPYAISWYEKNNSGTDSGCVEFMNNAARLFNQKLVALVDELNVAFKDGKFVYIDAYGTSSGGPTNKIFTVADVGCCPVNEHGFCIPYRTPCENKDEYIFWDAFNPTTAFNRLVAHSAYRAYNAASDNDSVDIPRLVHEFGGRTGPTDDMAQRTAS